MYRNQTSEHTKNRNQNSFLQVSLSSIYIVQKQKNRTLTHWNYTEQRRYKIVQNKKFITPKSHQILTYLIPWYLMYSFQV